MTGGSLPIPRQGEEECRGKTGGCAGGLTQRSQIEPGSLA